MLQEGNAISSDHITIDFNDMIYLPNALGLQPKKQYGYVFVDECQDLSQAQIGIVKKYLRQDGRLLAVGDPYQAIYGFAGADSDSYEQVKEAFNCQEFSLAECFRCPQAVVEIARTIRPDITTNKTEGSVMRIEQDAILHYINVSSMKIN